MLRGQYSREIRELSVCINELLHDDSIKVSKVLHGNHNRQVHLYLSRHHNGGKISRDIVLFVELDIDVPTGVNVYSSNVIKTIKRNIDINKLKEKVKGI